MPMTSSDIERLLAELYEIDPSLRANEESLKNAIAAFSREELPAPLDRQFVMQLRRNLLAREPKLSFAKKIFNFNHTSMVKKSFVLGGIVTAAIVVAAVTMLPTPGSRTLGAELAYAEGAVLYRTDGGVWQEAAPGVSLKEGDGVKVIGLGRAVVMLDDGSAVRINNDSEVTLAELDPEHMQVINEYGQVYTRVVKSKERLFDVNVKGTFYRALGTAYMTVNTDETQGVEVYHSAVQVIDEGIAKDETKAVVPEGSAYYEVNVEAPKKVDEVTALSTLEVKSDEFVTWNSEQDASDKKFETQLGVLAVVNDNASDAATSDIVVSEPATETSADSSITLSSVGTNALTWTKPADTGANGFKVVYSKSPEPTYPPRATDKAIYVDVGTTLPWLYAFDGSGTYYVRVCDYKTDGTCGEYSNTATISLEGDVNDLIKVAMSELNESTAKNTATVTTNDEEETVVASEPVKKEVKTTAVVPTEQYPGAPGESSVTSITLVANSPEAEHVSWTVDGALVPGMDRGVRVIFSKNPNPTYGTNLSLPVGWKNYAKIYAKEGTGTYYVRVCEFLGDRCGVYSNEVTVTVRGSGAGGEYYENGEWKSNRTASGAAGSTVTSMTITADDPTAEHVSWSVNGSWVQGMDRGFRVLYSKSPNPTLGGAGVLAQPVGYKRYTKLWPKQGAGTYYVRVCEYLGSNTCGTYSNEITVTLGEPGTTGGEYKGDRMMQYAN